MSLILHITPRSQWDEAKTKGVYHCESLKVEGFIHCSTPAQVLPVANAFFTNQQGLVLLCIDSDRLQSELRYEPVEGMDFPHLYGTLNVDAVVEVLEFSPNAGGQFELPSGLAKQIENWDN